MKSILQQIANETKLKERAELEAVRAELANPKITNDRRNFLKKAALGGIALGGLMHLSIEDTIAQTTQNVSRASSPSDLKITDLRFAEKWTSGRWSQTTRIIRIDTNQGIYGIGDIRDGTDHRLAGMLKSKIVGLNPCNVEMIFKVIKQFGGHGREGGGVSGVETACWDIVGKALGVPVWQLLGGRYRDKVRLYADTRDNIDAAIQLKGLKDRLEVQKFTWLKMDLSAINININNPGSISNNKFWGVGQASISSGSYENPPSMEKYMSYSMTEAPFTQIQITEKGLELIAEKVANVRNIIGPEIPLCCDHFGYMDENQFIRMGRAVEKYRLAWLEDTVPWFYTDRQRTLKNSIETPICTGETIYMLNGMLGGFKKLIDEQAVDIIHPDLLSAGGILETKKIGDYAEEAGIPMAMHANSTPIGFMANVHCAAATENFLVLEHHQADDPKWEGMVKITGSQPIITNGYANIPLDSPGLGIELNDEAIKARMTKGARYFEPTPEWDSNSRVVDRLWQ